MTERFAEVTDADIAKMIAASPLCWIVPHAEPPAAILMPVILEQDDDGAAVSLLGHLPRRSPAAAALAEHEAASFLFLGPNGYVSPAMAGKRDWAPTWNFVSVKMTATVALDPALTRESVEALVELVEGPGGWTPAELGNRYEALLARIIGFRARIEDVVPRFKLGQDEHQTVLHRLLDVFADHPLGAWMRHKNTE